MIWWMVTVLRTTVERDEQDSSAQSDYVGTWHESIFETKMNDTCPYLNPDGFMANTTAGKTASDPMVVKHATVSMFCKWDLSMHSASMTVKTGDVRDKKEASVNRLVTMYNTPFIEFVTNAYRLLVSGHAVATKTTPAMAETTIKEILARPSVFSMIGAFLPPKIGPDKDSNGVEKVSGIDWNEKTINMEL